MQKNNFFLKISINIRSIKKQSIYFAKKSNLGFTLIEVLLALAILAIALTALLKVSAENLHNTNRIKEKTIKHLVAMQAINQVQMHSLTLRPGLPTNKAFRAFGTTWYFQAKLTPTAIKNIQKLSIKVSNQQHGPYTDNLMAFYHEK